MKCPTCERIAPDHAVKEALAKSLPLLCLSCETRYAPSALGEALEAEPEFDGDVYDSEEDKDRLTGQIKRVFDCIKDGSWRTLDEIAASTGDPHASISAQLRHLRKERFGSYSVEKRHRGPRSAGLWEYKLYL